MELLLKSSDSGEISKNSDLVENTTEEHVEDSDLAEKSNEEQVVFSKDQCIVFHHSSQLFLGVIEEVHPDKLWVIPLENAIKRSSRSKKVGEVWKYPVDIVILEVNPVDILPVWPVVELDQHYSRNKSGQAVFLRLMNDDIIRLFCKENI